MVLADLATNAHLIEFADLYGDINLPLNKLFAVRYERHEKGQQKIFLHYAKTKMQISKPAADHAFVFATYNSSIF